MSATQLPRRRVEEIMLRYKLHPKLRDIYVEGFFDKEIIQSWLCHQGMTTTGVYSIDTIELPMEVLSKYDLTEGQKQRVITLAKEIAASGHACSVLCVVDLDFDKFLGSAHSAVNLVATDFACLESYFWVDDILKAAFLAAVPAPKRNALLLIDIENILRGLYALRLADQKLGLSLNWVDIKTYVTMVEGRVGMDLGLYGERVLLASGKSRERVSFFAQVQSFTNALPRDSRHCLQGHDLLKLLSIVV